MIFHIIYLLFTLIIYTHGSSALQNVALNKPAYMPSQENAARVPGNAVDGVFSTPGSSDQQCITTDNDGNPAPWWKADLLQTYLITSVLIQTSGMVFIFFSHMNIHAVFV